MYALNDRNNYNDLFKSMKRKVDFYFLVYRLGNKPFNCGGIFVKNASPPFGWQKWRFFRGVCEKILLGSLLKLVHNMRVRRNNFEKV